MDEIVKGIETLNIKPATKDETTVLMVSLKDLSKAWDHMDNCSIVANMGGHSHFHLLAMKLGFTPEEIDAQLIAEGVTLHQPSAKMIGL
jgi:hypothetical protein